MVRVPAYVAIPGVDPVTALHKYLFKLPIYLGPDIWETQGRAELLTGSSSPPPPRQANGTVKNKITLAAFLMLFQTL